MVSSNKSPNKKSKAIIIIADWILLHTRIIMPVILIACVLVTVVIALNANEKAGPEKEVETVSAAQVESEPTGADGVAELTVPDHIPLEKNQYPEVNELINEYHRLLTEGDVEGITAIYTGLDELALIRIAEMAKYIDHYENIDVYTKAGLTENSYVAYVSTEVQLKDIDALIPGFRSYYIMKEPDGRLMIQSNSLDDNVFEYVKAITLQDDVVDLNNKVTVAYNDLIASNQELEEYVAYMTTKLEEDVGEVLARNEQPEITAESVKDEMEQAAAPETPAETAGPADTDADAQAGTETSAASAVSAPFKAQATEVVNIRSSDSETADRLDKAMTGQEFTVLEEKGNGWSRIEYNDREAYIKSEYLERTGEDAAAEAAPEPAESASQAVTDGTVKVKESVKVRSKAGTDGESLGTVYSGEELDFIEQMSNGWTKVEYNGKIGYVKSEYVE